MGLKSNVLNVFWSLVGTDYFDCKYLGLLEDVNWIDTFFFRLIAWGLLLLHWDVCYDDLSLVAFNLDLNVTYGGSDRSLDNRSSLKSWI